MRRISERRLMVGGAAMFAQIKRNHHIVNRGFNVRIPFVRTRLRVCVDS